jgi:alkylhydroperoxidase family enzyme
MPYIPALKREDLPELADYFARSDARMGFVTNAQLTMAYRPDILKAFVGMAAAVFTQYGGVTPQLKALVGHIASNAAGCEYCMSHTASNALRPGYDAEPAKVAAVWEYETSPLFTEAHIDRLRKHFTDAEIVEINAVVAFYGFLNRWNDSLATELEPMPTEVGERLLADKGWHAGKHAPADSEAAE